MKVTIITVSYNSEKYIERCIKSVLNQDYKNVEYIIIDGNSTDNTIDIINKFRSSISVFISEPDNGLYEAMNKGINLASGDLIGILNSDDFFFNNETITNVVNFHDLNNIDASVGNILQCNSSNKIIRRYSSKNWKPIFLKYGFMPPHPAIFIKNEIYKKFNKYDINLKISADYDLITRFFLLNKIKWKYSNLTTTVMQSGGLSSSGFKSYNIISHEIIDILKKYNISHNKYIIKIRVLWKALQYLNN